VWGEDGVVAPGEGEGGGDFGVVGGASEAEGDGEFALVVVNVESDAAEEALVEELEEVVGRGEFAAGDVDEDNAGPGAAEEAGVEVASVLRGEVHGADDDVGPWEGGFGGGVVDEVVFLDEVNSAHFHFEASAEFDDFGADVSDADDEQALAAAFETGNVVSVEVGEVAHLLRQFAQEGHPEEEGLFCDCAVAVEGQVAAGELGAGELQVMLEVVVAGAAGEDGR